MAQRKAALLRVSLGTEGFRIYMYVGNHTTMPLFVRESISERQPVLFLIVLRSLAISNEPANWPRSTLRKYQKWRRNVSSPPSSSTNVSATSLPPGRVVTASANGCFRSRPIGSRTNSLAVPIERAMKEARALSSGSNQLSASVSHVFSRRDQPSSSSAASSGCGELW
jgi:hypothetical protein